MDVTTFQLLGLDKPAPRAVNGHSREEAAKFNNHDGDAIYQPCPEAYPGKNIPRGRLLSFRDWTCDHYPRTHRRVWIYVPPELPENGCDPGLIQFNDGQVYLDKDGAVRATFVLDALHAAGDIDATAAVFVTPGMPTSINPDPHTWSVEEWEVAAEQRSIEYDSLRPEYGEFLIEELLPFAEREAGFRFTQDPARRICCGASSGGIAAFTCAWHFPNVFSRVLSHVGSFANIKGGHNYPWLVRTTPRKDIRVFLQSGENDMQAISGDWPLANKTMANALDWAGYDYRFEFGAGGHSVAHGGALFADSIRWLLR